jgi:hypothetical protein
MFNKTILMCTDTCRAQQSVTKLMVMIVMNLVTPNAAAKLRLLLNKPVSDYMAQDIAVVD